MPRHVAFRVLCRDDLLVLADGDDDSVLELAHERMRRVDAGVEDANADVLARGPAERPLTRDPLRPMRRERDPVDRVLGEAPCGQRGFARIPAVTRHFLHGLGLYGARPAESLPVQLSWRRARISSRRRRSGS